MPNIFGKVPKPKASINTVISAHDAPSGVTICSLPNAKVGQILAVLQKYMDANLQNWN